MYPDLAIRKAGPRQATAGPHHQRGAGLPVALFVITVLALLVFTMADLQSSASHSVSLQVQSQRAFFAAESGAQIALTRILPGTESAAEVWSAAVTDALDGREIAFPADGLKGCSARLRVEPVHRDPDPTDILLVRLVSTGSCGAGGTASASRIVEVKVR